MHYILLPLGCFKWLLTISCNLRELSTRLCMSDLSFVPTSSLSPLTAVMVKQPVLATYSQDGSCPFLPHLRLPLCMNVYPSETVKIHNMEKGHQNYSQSQTMRQRRYLYTCRWSSPSCSDDSHRCSACHRWREDTLHSDTSRSHACFSWGQQNGDAYM